MRRTQALLTIRGVKSEANGPIDARVRCAPAASSLFCWLRSRSSPARAQCRRRRTSPWCRSPWHRRSPPTRSIPGDKLRIVVFGQEGLSSSYTVDASGRITMALIGAVPARGLTPGGTLPRHHRETEERLHPRPARRGRDRGLSAVLHPRRGDDARPIRLRAEHDGGDRGGHRRRLHAARATPEVVLNRNAGPETFRATVPVDTPIRPGDTIVVKERWF